MKKTLWSFGVVASAVFILSSCSPLKVTFSSSEKQKIEEIALVSTYLGIQLPVLPLLDAAVMNEKTRSMSNEINLLFEESIDGMRAKVASLMEGRLNCKVIYGESLHQRPGFKEFAESNSPAGVLVTGVDDFPEVVSATGDANPFLFEKGNIAKYFKEPSNFRSTIVDICKQLDLDYIAVTHTQLSPSPGSLVLPATLFNLTTVYLFDRNGTLLATGRNTLYIRYRATEFEGFEQALDIHEATITPIIDKISDKYGN